MVALSPRHRRAAALGLGLLAVAATAWGARDFITVGTGEVAGVYHQAGGGICSLVNAGRSEHGIRCTVSTSAGSLANIDALRRGERVFGLAQSDLVDQAYRGSGVYADADPFRGLRTVAALHPERLTVVAADDTDIETIQDLLGQRVNLGPERSGAAATMRALMDALGWTADDFGTASRMGAGAQTEALCGGELDVGVYVTGHPNDRVERALDCGGRLVAVQGPAVERLVQTTDHYTTTVIPAGAYAGLADDVPTYGVTALLLSSTNASRETVAAVARALVDGLGAFRDWHPAFADLQAAGMARGAAATEAPLHPGAEAVFGDADLL